MPDKIEYGYKMPTINTTKEELLKIAADWDKECGGYYSELKKIWDVNEAYYKGRQTELEKIPSNMSNCVQNHIFMGVETIVPIMTANPPRFMAEPPTESDEAIKYANSIQKVLSIIYDEKDIRTKGEMLMRHMIIYRFGAWRPFYNETTKEVDVRYVRPQRLRFPKTSHELPYICEKQDLTSEEFKDYFGAEKFSEFIKSKGTNLKDEDPLLGVFLALHHDKNNKHRHFCLGLPGHLPGASS